MSQRNLLAALGVGVKSAGRNAAGARVRMSSVPAIGVCPACPASSGVLASAQWAPSPQPGSERSSQIVSPLLRSSLRWSLFFEPNRPASAIRPSGHGLLEPVPRWVVLFVTLLLAGNLTAHIVSSFQKNQRLNQ